MRHFERYEDLKSVLVEMANGSGVFSATYKEMADKSHIPNLSSVKNYVERLVSEGILQRITEPRRGVKGTQYLLVNDSNRNAVIEDFTEYNCWIGQILIEHQKIKIGLIYLKLMRWISPEYFYYTNVLFNCVLPKYEYPLTTPTISIISGFGISLFVTVYCAM